MSVLCGSDDDEKSTGSRSDCSRAGSKVGNMRAKHTPSPAGDISSHNKHNINIHITVKSLLYKTHIYNVYRSTSSSKAVREHVARYMYVNEVFQTWGDLSNC